jgi:mono/diheme cytochrome c family protein
MRRGMRGGRLGWLWAMLLAMLPVAGVASEDQEQGRAFYLKYCGACHGESGKGDGVVSGFMRPKPTDLTEIARKAGGTFPFVETMQIIDGRDTRRAHGDPDMPVWGEIFRPPSGASGDERAQVAGKLLILTEYLRSIQQ